jgi:hypothetical protein
MKYVNKKLEYRGRCQIEGQVIEYERVIHYDAHGPEEENWMYRGVPCVILQTSDGRFIIAGNDGRGDDHMLLRFYDDLATPLTILALTQ